MIFCGPVGVAVSRKVKHSMVSGLDSGCRPFGKMSVSILTNDVVRNEYSQLPKRREHKIYFI
jgi:hypothetical protein